MMCDFDRFEIGELLEGAKMLHQYYVDVAESSIPSEWDGNIRDAQNLVEKLESLSMEANNA